MSAVTGECEPCSRTHPDGTPQRDREEPRPAAYLWYVNGTGIRLCVRCCVIWRMNAADDPELMPTCITNQEEP